MMISLDDTVCQWNIDHQFHLSFDDIDFDEIDSDDIDVAVVRKISYDFIIDNAELQSINQCRDVHWWIDQLENQSWMISACSNDVFS
jgi:hypothetical protein